MQWQNNGELLLSNTRSITMEKIFKIYTEEDNKASLWRTNNIFVYLLHKLKKIWKKV